MRERVKRRRKKRYARTADKVGKKNSRTERNKTASRGGTDRERKQEQQKGTLKQQTQRNTDKERDKRTAEKNRDTANRLRCMENRKTRTHRTAERECGT